MSEYAGELPPPTAEPPAGGWVKLYRKALYDGWLREHDLFIFWVYCLLRANHKDGKVFVSGQQINLGSGQFITGRDQVCRDTGLTEQKYRTALKRLKATGSITTITTNRYTIITITNWSSYQVKPSEHNEQDNEQTNTQPTSSQRAANDKQEEKRTKKFKNIIDTNGVEWTVDALFEAFWRTYPRKDGRAAALKAFKATVKNLDDANRFKAAIRAYYDKLEADNTDPQYIKTGSKFFTNWSDWVPPSPPPKKIDPNAEARRLTLAAQQAQREKEDAELAAELKAQGVAP